MTNPTLIVDYDYNSLVVDYDPHGFYIPQLTPAFPGTKGPPGPSSGGAGMAFGAGAPDAGDGTDGQFYIDTTAGRLYGPKANGAWPTTYWSLAPADTTTPTDPNTLPDLQAGFAYLLDGAGNYLVDSGGTYLIGAA